MSRKIRIFCSAALRQSKWDNAVIWRCKCVPMWRKKTRLIRLTTSKRRSNVKRFVSFSAYGCVCGWEFGRKKGIENGGKIKWKLVGALAQLWLIHSLERIFSIVFCFVSYSHHHKSHIFIYIECIILSICMSIIL